MNENLIVSLKDIVVEFDGQKVLDGLSLDIHDKEFVTFLGPSGCGKTTTLRVIAGFVTPKSGNVFFDGKDIANMPPYKRPVNTVFQKYALFPHLNVFENVAFGLRLKKMTEDEIRPKVLEMLEIVGLKGFERRSIYQLSGGQQQRVAIARSLVNQPRVLLLDEPLGALDLKLRKEMQLELKRLQREMNITFVYVTHDQSEAMALSDSIIIMNKGVVAQVGTPQEIYYHPNSEFVADFIGEANFLKGSFVRSTDNGRAVMNIEGGEIEVAPQGELEAGHEYTLVLRPEAATLGEEGGLPCRVVLSCFMGSYQNYHVMVGDTLVKLSENNLKNKRIYAVGEECRLRFDPDAVHVL